MRLVASLKQANAVATFFDLGARAEASQALVELQRSVGQVANHSYSHLRMPAVSSARRVQELQATARVLDYPNTLFRPPYGETSVATDADIRRVGLTPVYWTVDAQDARLDAKAITDRALTVKPGGIILLHDGVDATVAAVPRHRRRAQAARDVPGLHRGLDERGPGRQRCALPRGRGEAVSALASETEDVRAPSAGSSWGRRPSLAAAPRAPRIFLAATDAARCTEKHTEDS
jgi:peptidoglycan/xylan/chitin deacetylase (PgdA/CDA1 family)